MPPDDARPRLRWRWSDRTWMWGCAHIGQDEYSIIGIFLGNAKIMRENSYGSWAAMLCVQRMLSSRREGAVIDEWARGLRA